MQLVRKTPPQSIMLAVSYVSGFTPDELKEGGKGGTICQWRYLGMYVARERGHTMRTSGELFGKHYSSVNWAIQKVEKNMSSVKPTLKTINSILDKEDEHYQEFINDQADTATAEQEQ